MEQLLLIGHIGPLIHYYVTFNDWETIVDMFYPYEGYVLDVSGISLLPDVWNGSIFHWKVMHHINMVPWNVELFGL